MRVNRREALALAAAAASAQQNNRSGGICFLTAVEMERRIRRKQLSAVEALQAHLDQIARVNPKVNAIVTLVPEAAMAQARRADEAAARNRFLGPLHGLPIAHKDLVETKGIRTTYGSPIFADHVPDFDALLIERLRQAGAITIGKTNTPEFGAGSQTFNEVFGATKNPWDLTKTCGGSSGGAAVALACGMIPIADGSDMGGSLRNPASFCNVVGFRPSPGRVPRAPTLAAWNVLSVLGPMARTVADSALLLSAIAGPDPRDPLSISEDGARFARPLGREFKGTRIGWCSNFAGLPFDRGVLEVFLSRRRAFEGIGCIVEEADPDFSGADEAFKTLRALSFHQQHAAKLAAHRGKLKDTVVEEIERGARLTGAQIAEAETLRSRLFARLAQLMMRYEFLALPVTQVPPFDVTLPYVREVAGVRMESYIDWMRSCYFISITSLPAISVPGGLTSANLPVGIQIVGRRQDDWGVLQIAHAFEQAAGLQGRIPPL